MNFIPHYLEIDSRRALSRFKTGLTTLAIFALGAGPASLHIHASTPVLLDSATISPTVTPLKTPRRNHTATTLPSGQVLLVGGVGSDGRTLDSAELYDPSTGTFSATGSLGSARANHTATLLPSGKVLIAGGGNYSGTWPTGGELYDPVTGRFTPTGNLLMVRHAHGAVLLPNGKVLIAGGWGGGNYLDRGELYNPATGAFSTAGMMSFARSSITPLLLPNGKVLIVGGEGPLGVTATAEIYEPGYGAYGRFRPPLGGDMAVARSQHSVTLLENGQALIAGGIDATGSVTATAETFDPDRESFSRTGSLVLARARHQGLRLPDGTILIAGGSQGGTSPNDSLSQVYDPIAGTFTLSTSLEFSRLQHTTTLLPDGKVLIAGGHYNGTYPKTEELYDSHSSRPGMFTEAGSMQAPVDHPAVALYTNSKAIVAGGIFANTGQVMNLCLVYDSQTRTFSRGRALITPRAHNTATRLLDGRVVLIGGFDTNKAAISKAEIIDGVLGGGTIFGPAGALFEARFDHTATLLPDGRVLVTGGGSTPGTATASIEIFDPTSKTFTRTGSMASPRRGHTATLLPDGRVLLVGGTTGFESVGFAELFDPTMGTCSPTATPPLAYRLFHTATLMQDGQVLLAGGNVGGRIQDPKTAELYNPLTGLFTPIPGRMLAGLSHHTATLLPSGRVLLAGGYDAGTLLPRAELYNPLTGRFEPTAPLVAPRADHGAVLFPEGQVLLLGGSNTEGGLAAAETYR